MNAEFAYLLGMIIGKGTVIRGNRETEIRIEIPHKNLIIEGMDAQLSVRASITDIRDRLEPFIDTRMNVTTQNNRTILSFYKDNRNFIVREINSYLGNLESCKDFRIPYNIFDESEDIKKEFLRGVADVTAHIRRSNTAYGKPYNHRVYIEIPVNWFLVVDIANLLMELDIPVHTIDWGHPNTRDPYLNDYNQGRTMVWFREHQIKIFAEEFERVGFNIIHKNRILKILADENKRNWDIYVREKINSAKTSKKREEWEQKLGHIEIEHHKYYWERRKTHRSKPPHPMENNENIPDIIRGRHFDSWRDIARALGYPRGQYK